MTSLPTALFVLLAAGANARAAVVEKLPATTRTSSSPGYSMPAPLELKAFAAPGAPGLQAPVFAPSAPAIEAPVAGAAPGVSRPAAVQAAPAMSGPAMSNIPAAPGAIAPGPVAPGPRGPAAPAKGAGAPLELKLKTLKAAAASEAPVFWDGINGALKEAELGQAPEAAWAPPRRALARPFSGSRGDLAGEATLKSRPIDALEAPSEPMSTARIKRFLEEILFDDAATAPDGRPLAAPEKAGAARSRAGHMLDWIDAVNPANRKPAAGVKHQLQYDLPDIEARLRGVKRIQGRLKQAEARGGDTAALRAELDQARAELAEPLAQARAALTRWLPGELGIAPRIKEPRSFVDANLAVGMLDFLFAKEVKVKDFIMAAEFAHAIEGGRMVRMGAINYAELVERVERLRARAAPEQRAAVERITRGLLGSISAEPFPSRAPSGGEHLMDIRFEVDAPAAGDAITLAARSMASRNIGLSSPLIRAGVGRDGHNASSPLFFKDIAGLMEVAETGGVYRTSDAGIYEPLEQAARGKKTVSGLTAVERPDGLIQVDIGAYDHGSYRFFVQPVRAAGYEGFALKR